MMKKGKLKLNNVKVTHTGRGVVEGKYYGTVVLTFKLPQEIRGRPVIRLFVKKVRGGGVVDETIER